MRRVLVAGYLVVVVVHGLIHVMGTVEAYGGDVPQLTEPVSPLLGAAWLVAAVLVVASAGLVAVAHAWAWPVTAFAAVVSQVLIMTSWSDAKAGTVANVVMLLAAASWFLGQRRSAPSTWSAPEGPTAAADGSDHAVGRDARSGRTPVDLESGSH